MKTKPNWHFPRFLFYLKDCLQPLLSTIEADFSNSFLIANMMKCFEIIPTK